MAKSKKRKPQQQQKPKAAPVEASAEATVSEEAKEQSVSVATASVATPTKKTEKPKATPKAKAAPVVTKKRSRFMFFVDAFNELRKAHWPTRKETMRLSVLVFAVCVAVGAILGGLDFLFTKLMGLVLFGG